MYKLFTAIAVCMAFSQPAWAGGPGRGVSATGHEAPPPLVQVRLAAPGPAAPANSQQTPVVVAALQEDAAHPAAEAEAEAGTQRDTNRGVLLAALALMAGIVLRRWGTGRQ